VRSPTPPRPAGGQRRRCPFIAAVARDLGMVSSAIYRYFASRDELLTALIIDGYNAIGAAVEHADATCARDDYRGRWLAGVPRRPCLGGGPSARIRADLRLARARLSGPADTIAPAARSAVVFGRLISAPTRPVSSLLPRCEQPVPQELSGTPAGSVRRSCPTYRTTSSSRR